jgi:hypothetical protein
MRYSLSSGTNEAQQTHAVKRRVKNVFSHASHKFTFALHMEYKFYSSSSYPHQYLLTILRETHEDLKKELYREPVPLTPDAPRLKLASQES